MNFWQLYRRLPSLLSVYLLRLNYWYDHVETSFYCSYWRCWWIIVESISTDKWLIMVFFQYWWRLLRRRWNHFLESIAIHICFTCFSNSNSLCLTRIYFHCFLTDKLASSGKDISSTGCYPDVSWWGERKVSTVLYCLLWSCGK